MKIRRKIKEIMEIYFYRSLEFTLAVDCPMRCVYCPQDKFIKEYYKKSNITRLSFESFRQIFDKIPLDVNIYFSGHSEPWLNPDCTKMLLYAFEKKHKITVFTTGFGMTIQDVKLIKDLPFKNFIFHLLSEKESNIQINSNYLEVLEEIVKSNIKRIDFLFLSQDHSSVPEQVANILRKYNIKPSSGPLRTRGGSIKVPNGPNETGFKGKIHCLRLKRNVVLPNGDVLLCSMDWTMRHVIGNLLTMNYHDLHNSDEYKFIKKGLRDESKDILCRHCDVPFHPLLELDRDIRMDLKRK